MWGAVEKGYLNVISSDHCGFNWKDNKHQGKDNFVNIPNGAPGMGDRMNVIWTYGVETGKYHVRNTLSFVAQILQK